jgi:hypothetical protein
MDEARSDSQRAGGRLCLCCGTQSATRSIPACWDHWNVLPEDLRSLIVISYGRGQAKTYGEGLMEAVRVWRVTGAWRSGSNKRRAAIEHTSPGTPSASLSESRVISLVERRQTFAPRRLGSLPSVAEFAERTARARSQAADSASVGLWNFAASSALSLQITRG